MLNAKPSIAEKIIYGLSAALTAFAIILFWVCKLDTNLYYVISLFVMSSLSIPIMTSLISALSGGISVHLLYSPIVSAAMLALNWLLTLDLKLFADSGHLFNHFGNSDITYFAVFALIVCFCSSVAGIAAHYLIDFIKKTTYENSVNINKRYCVIAISVYACSMLVITALYWILGKSVTNFEYCLIFRSFLLCILIPALISIFTTVKVGLNRKLILLPIVFVSGERINYISTIVLNSIINKEDAYYFAEPVASWLISILSCVLGIAIGSCIIFVKRFVIKSIKPIN